MSILGILIAIVLATIVGLVIKSRKNKKIESIQDTLDVRKSQIDELYGEISKLNTIISRKDLDIIAKDNTTQDILDGSNKLNETVNKQVLIFGITTQVLNLLYLNLPNYIIATKIYNSKSDKSYLLTLKSDIIGADIKALNTTKDKSIPHIEIVLDSLFKSSLPEFKDFELSTFIKTLPTLDMDTLSMLYAKLDSVNTSRK